MKRNIHYIKVQILVKVECDKMKEKQKNRRNKSLPRKMRLHAKHKIPQAIKTRIQWNAKIWNYFYITKLVKRTKLDECVREFAKRELIDAIKLRIKTEGYFRLLELSKDVSLPKEARLLAKKNLLKGAERTIKADFIDVDSWELFKLAKERGLPKDVRERAEIRAAQIKAMEQEEARHSWC